MTTGDEPCLGRRACTLGPALIEPPITGPPNRRDRRATIPAGRPDRDPQRLVHRLVCPQLRRWRTRTLNTVLPLSRPAVGHGRSDGADLAVGGRAVTVTDPSRPRRARGRALRVGRLLATPVRENRATTGTPSARSHPAEGHVGTTSNLAWVM
jgi:hypothetical protein